jgi:hypothetical protein
MSKYNPAERINKDVNDAWAGKMVSSMTVEDALRILDPETTRQAQSEADASAPECAAEALLTSGQPLACSLSPLPSAFAD